MKHWVLCFLLVSAALFGAPPFRMKERIEKAKVGDYMVTEAGKMITVLSIRSISPNSLILEEISVPSQNLKKRPDSWPEWVKANAPGHTSWSMIEIDPKSGQLLECFSFSRSAWIQLSQKESLIATLLFLPMKKVSPDKQRKIGPPPMPGEPDFRKVWVPPLVFEGKKLESPNFEVFETIWPKDDSELSNQEVMIYFDHEKQLPFPFWIQVQTSHATAALRTIDSGKNLPIIHRKIPRRVPEFVGLPRKTEDRLLLNLKSPKYYKQFELYAIDVTTKEKQILPITHSLIDGEDEWKTVAIELDELESTLETDHRYNWLLVPVGFSDSYTETAKPFLWTIDHTDNH
ncbi:MAG: hypothetical protein K1X28_09225 [Parachlamydiales bacterium]|nr:hypothetical protein [Parachlamydiales bacterium]